MYFKAKKSWQMLAFCSVLTACGSDEDKVASPTAATPISGSVENPVQPVAVLETEPAYSAPPAINDYVSSNMVIKPDTPVTKPTTVLQAIIENEILRVATRNGPTTIYTDQNGDLTGPEYDMVSAFSESLGVQTKYVFVDSVEDALAMLHAGKVDLVAAGVSAIDNRKKSVSFGPSYLSVSEQLVCLRGGIRPKKLKHLHKATIKVTKGSSYEDTLKNLQAKGVGFNFTLAQGKTTEGLIRDVWAKKLHCTVADSNLVDINRRYYPTIVVPMRLKRSTDLAWATQATSKQLQNEINDWFSDYKKSGALEQLNEVYYAPLEKFDYVDTRTLVRRIESRLPRYEKHFKAAAKKYGLPWKLLAAQAYQESHWNPNAKSPTGVRGMMMLTRRTARSLGIKNRRDAIQSINGGAKYMYKMRKRIPKQVQEPDRTWFALAAYNVGMGHIHDAQRLARKLGLNPYVWRDLREVLPKLSETKYYKQSKYGYCRGSEPVHYVQRIRDYQLLISHHLQQENDQ